jgi:hypothetical protein
MGYDRSNVIRGYLEGRVYRGGHPGVMIGVGIEKQMPDRNRDETLDQTGRKRWEHMSDGRAVQSVLFARLRPRILHNRGHLSKSCQHSA